jgi:Flp pilus assembly protein TadG
VCAVIKILKSRFLRSASRGLTDSEIDARQDRLGLRQLACGVLRDTRASAFVMMAIGLLALATATGVGVDFARGLNFKSALQGAVDSASIAGASVYINNGYAAQATTAATNYLNNALPALPTNNGVTSSISVSSSSPWTVTVNATASINSTFNGLFENTIPVQVSATAHGPSNPNINFYMLLDSSPSMAIAATPTGIQTMINNTQQECDSPPNGGATCGCGFACHESNPSGEGYYVPTGTTNTITVTSSNGTNYQDTGVCSATPVVPPHSPQGTQATAYVYCPASGTGNPGGEDNYALAQSLGVTLRIDNLRLATESLMTTARTTETTTSATYGMAIYTFDANFNTIQTLTTNLTTAQASAANIQMLEVYQNNMLTSSNNNADEDTNYDTAMSNINTIMPNPGYGTTAQGDTPQEVLFFVTDGVEDQYDSPALNPTTDDPGRQQYMMNSNYDWCSAVKNRGIRIAVLYTTYDPIPNNGWYENFDGSGNGVSSFQSQIAGQLQTCASPGLFFQVDTGGDITAAMAALFTSAVQSAYISH